MSKPNYGQKSMHEYRYRREEREPGYIAQQNKRCLERYYKRKAEKAALANKDPSKGAGVCMQGCRWVKRDCAHNCPVKR